MSIAHPNDLESMSEFYNNFFGVRPLYCNLYLTLLLEFLLHWLNRPSGLLYSSFRQLQARLFTENVV